MESVLIWKTKPQRQSVFYELRYASAYDYVYGNFSWWLTWLDFRVYELSLISNNWYPSESCLIIRKISFVVLKTLVLNLFRGNSVSVYDYPS
jgi:hypothetical protein